MLHATFSIKYQITLVLCYSFSDLDFETLNFNFAKATVDNYESIEDAMSVANLELLKKLLSPFVQALIERALQEGKVHYNPSRYVYDLDQYVSSTDDKKTFIREMYHFIRETYYFTRETYYFTRETYHRKSVSEIDLEKNRNGTFTAILKSELLTEVLLNLLEIERLSESRVIIATSSVDSVSSNFNVLSMCFSTVNQSGSDNVIMDQLQNNRQEIRCHQIMLLSIASHSNQVISAVAREGLQAIEESRTNQHEAHSRSSLKSLKAKYQCAKSSGHSHHSSTGVSRQLRKEYQESGSDADNGSQVET